MMVKNNGRKSFMSAPKRRGMTPQQREAAYLQSMQSARNRSGYPLPRIPRGPRQPQRAVQRQAPRPRRPVQRNRGGGGAIGNPSVRGNFFGGTQAQMRMQGTPANNPMPLGRRNMPVQGRLSKCASLYAVGVVNPFSFVDGSLSKYNTSMGINVENSELPCIPEYPAKSRKTKVFARGIFTTNVTGGAGLLLAPNRLANLAGTDDYTPWLIIDTTVAAGPIFPNADSGGVVTPGYAVIMPNSDYTAPALAGVGTTTRLVGAGLRIRYAGTELNRGGIVHCVEHISHSSLSGLTVATVSQFESYFRTPVIREWLTLVYTPINTLNAQANVDELHFNNDPSRLFSVLGAAAGPSYPHFMGMVVNASAQSVFEYEVVGLFEIQGPTIRDLTYSESDIVGSQMIRNVVRPETQLIRNEEGPSGIFKLIRQGAQLLTDIVPIGIGIGKTIARALF